MKKIIFSLFSILLMAGCSTAKKDKDIKAQDLTKNLDRVEAATDEVSVGVDEDNNVVTSEKTKLSEHIRKLVATIKQKQDELYGNKRFGTRGMYGKLERCLDEKNAKKAGGDGIVRAPAVPRDILLTEQELGYVDDDKFGYDKKGQLVALNETKLRDTLRDLEAKRNKIYEKEEEVLVELRKCEIQK